MHPAQSISARIILMATLISGLVAMGLAQDTNRYNTGGNYSIGAPTNTRFLMQMTTTNGLNPYGDNNLVWSHSGRYLATDRMPMGGGPGGNPYVNLIGFGKTGSITNLGARSDTNDWIFANTTDFTWNDDRILFVSPTLYHGSPPFPPRWLRLMSCTTTGDMSVAGFFSAPATASNHVYSPSVVYDPAIRKERLMFLVSNSTNSPPQASPLTDTRPGTTVNVYTVTYNIGAQPSLNWNSKVQLTAFTNNIQIQSVRWCPELGTNFQPLVNRYAILVQAPGSPGKKLYVFTGVRDVLANPATAPSNFDDPRFSLRETNVCGNSQMTWTFDGDFLMYGVYLNNTSQLYSVSSEGANTDRILFPTPGDNQFQNKQWLCISPNGMRAAFTINKQLFLLPLQCDNVAQTNAGTTNIITDGSYTKVVIPGEVLPPPGAGLTNYTFSIIEPTEVDTNNFPSEYTGNAREFGMSGVDTQVNFLAAVAMSLHFEDSDVPDGVSATNLSIFLFNSTNVHGGRTGTWTQVASLVDTNTHYIVSTNIQHFSIYALGSALGLPSAPTGLTASQGTYADKVTLAWNSVAEADGYIIFRSTSAATNSAGAISGSADTNYNDTICDAGTVYYYWVVASNSAGVSALSASNTGYRAAMPAPTGVIASEGIFVDKVQIAWNAVTNASGYTVWRSGTNDTNSAALVAGGITTTNYADTSAVVGLLYYYWVKATNTYGTSVFSSSASGWRADISSGVCADYDGDGKADPAVYDEATGTWRIKLSNANYYQVVITLNGLGGRGYASVSADYDGDRKADPAVYQELTGRWIIVLSKTDYTVTVILSQTLGGVGYSGMPADYDGDQLADPGVYQRERGDWKVLLSRANYSLVELAGLLGGTGYRAVAADYDGDLKADPAIYGESSGVWAFRLSNANYTTVILTQTLGGTGYLPVPADYDGDGKADPAVKSGTGNEWIVMLSSSNYTPVHLTLSFE